MIDAIGACSLAMLGLVVLGFFGVGVLVVRNLRRDS